MNGTDCKLYRQSGGSYGAPTWLEIEDIRDLQVNPTFTEGDAKTRGSIVDLAEPTRMQIEITGSIRVSVGNVDFVALDDAFCTRAALDIMALNGGSTTNGVRGWRAYYKVFSFTEDQSIDGVLYRNFTLKPCIPSDGNYPKRCVVAGGVPTFSDPG